MKSLIDVFSFWVGTKLLLLCLRLNLNRFKLQIVAHRWKWSVNIFIRFCKSISCQVSRLVKVKTYSIMYKNPTVVMMGCDRTDLFLIWQKCCAVTHVFSHILFSTNCRAFPFIDRHFNLYSGFRAPLLHLSIVIIVVI